jgi:hypothetical protein
MVSWGRSVIEPERGHVRAVGHQVVDGELVGFAICGALLVGDLPAGLADESGEFPKCSVCLDLLDE